MTIQERKSKMASNVQDWQTSGQSQVEYALTHNIKVATLRYQITRFRQMTDDQPSFIQIGGIGSQEIHIRYPHGVELILPAQVPAGLLRSLIHI